MLLAAVQRPISVACIGSKAERPLWMDRPSWYLVAEEDRMINPETQRFVAARMNANVVSHPVDHTPSVTAPAVGYGLCDRSCARCRGQLSSWEGLMQAEHKTTAGRLGAFFDAVIAVIITIMVLELKAPEENATFSALLPLWSTAVSYAISYLLHRHHLAQPSSPAALCEGRHASFDLGELRASLLCFAGAVRNRLDRANASRVGSRRGLRRDLRLHRLYLSCVRTAGLRSGRRFRTPGTRSTHRAPPLADHRADLRRGHAPAPS